MSSRCPSKLDHRQSGTVLQCQDVRGHEGNHVTTTEQWGDGHEDLIQPGTACCPGEWGYAGPVDMHSVDCPEYLAWASSHRREQKSPERRSIESSILTASLRRAITHLKDVAAGRVQADAHTDRLVELADELRDVVDRIRITGGLR